MSFRHGFDVGGRSRVAARVETDFLDKHQVEMTLLQVVVERHAVAVLDAQAASLEVSAERVVCRTEISFRSDHAFHLFGRFAK